MPEAGGGQSHHVLSATCEVRGACAECHVRLRGASAAALRASDLSRALDLSGALDPP
jgi:ferredoxin